MDGIFPNYKIDLKLGTIFSLISNREIACNATCKGGYHVCEIRDKYGNLYLKRNHVVFAEGANLPKHLWPIDKNGRRYIIDHIIPISNGGTDAYENLRLIPFSENAKNELTKINYSNAVRKRYENEAEREKISKAHRGKKQSEEHKRKLAELRKKPILQIKPNGEEIKWQSASDCERSSNGFYIQGNISSACNGNYSRKKNFHLYKGCEWYFI